MTGDREEFYRQRLAGLPPLQKVMLDLDVAVTGVPAERAVSQYHHYPADLLKWIEQPGGNPEWYLSDGGYSRVVWSTETGHIFLTSNSTSKAKANWDQAMPQRHAAEQYLNAEYRKLLGESKAETIVNTLLEMNYQDEPLPPKPEFGNEDDDLAFHTKSPFNAYSHSMERGHHPRLWQAVKGSVYEPLYRKRFNVTEKKEPSLKVLKKNRRQLEPDERRMVLRKKATWHNHGEKKPAPGVWKSVVDGKSWYVCNTHRAAAVKPTLSAAIKAFAFIKTTS